MKTSAEKYCQALLSAFKFPTIWRSLTFRVHHTICIHTPHAKLNYILFFQKQSRHVKIQTFLSLVLVQRMLSCLLPHPQTIQFWNLWLEARRVGACRKLDLEAKAGGKTGCSQILAKCKTKWQRWICRGPKIWRGQIQVQSWKNLIRKKACFLYQVFNLPVKWLWTVQWFLAWCFFRGPKTLLSLVFL